MRLVFATHNPHKLEEIRQLLGSEIKLISLDEIGCNEEIPEPFSTLEENAREKTRFVKENYGYDCFADDTGLEIDALNGAPGVYSARYAVGESKLPLKEKFRANIKKVLREMNGESNRRARFRTVISLHLNNTFFLFEGIVQGHILNEPKGEEGFGYDPVFQPEGFDKSFAEMTLGEKNRISHRAIAFEKLKAFLRSRVNPRA